MTTPASLVQGQLAYREDVAAATSGAPFSSTNTAGKLWLPIWSGEVIHAYDEYNQFEGMVQSKTIPSGTTVEIPMTGTVGLNPAWDAGEELIGGSDAATSTFQLKLDKRPMAAHFELDNVDLMLTQWEFRAELARQAALTLANTRDKQIYSYLVRAALTSPIANDPRPIGSATTNLDTAMFGSDSTDSLKLKSVGTTAGTAADRATGALSMLEKVEQYIVFLQENNVPYGQMYLAVSPRTFMDIRALGVARSNADLGGAFTVDIDADHVRSGGTRSPYFGGMGNGLGGPLNQAYGQIADTLEYMGCTIIKTNHGADELGDQYGDGTPRGLGEDKYNLDFNLGISESSPTTAKEGVRAVMFTPEAVGAIRLQGLKVDTVDDVRRNTTFTVASMMSGTGVLKPECAAVIHTGDAAAGGFDSRADLKTAAHAAADGYAEAT